MVLRIHNHGSEKNKNLIYIHNSQVFEKQITTHKTAGFFMEPVNPLRFKKIAGTSDSWILIFFQRSKTRSSLILKYIENPNWWFFINLNNLTKLVEPMI